MLGFLFGRKLENVLDETKTVRVAGVRFKIKKVNMLSHLDGSKVLIQSYDTHKTEGAKAAAALGVSENKIKSHYADILLAGVVSPKLVKDPEDKSGLCVDRLFVDWSMVEELYAQIMILTYGKKKMKRAISAAKGLSK